VNLYVVIFLAVCGVSALWFSGFVAGQDAAYGPHRRWQRISLAVMAAGLLLIMLSVQGAWYAHA